MIKVTAVKDFAVSEVLQLLKDNPFLPAFNYPGVEEAALLNFNQHDIQKTVADPSTVCLQATENGKTIGLLTLADLPWDSKILERKAGTLKHFIVHPGVENQLAAAKALLTEGIQAAREKKYDFLLGKVKTNDIHSIHALEENKFKLVDTLLDFVYDPFKKPFTSLTPPVTVAGASIRLATKEDEGELIQIASKAFQEHFGRYHSDENIPRDAATKVYKEWVTSSLNGYADFIIIVEVDGRIAAYSIWRNPTPAEATDNLQIGHYSLGAVNPDFYAMGMFYAITYEGMRRLVTKCKCIEGPTHINNYPVQRGYSRLGWQIFSAHHSFHLWL